MLCITRKSGERVKVGDCWIRVTNKNGRISMAFDAPPDIKIIREELLNGRSKSNDSVPAGGSTIQRGRATSD